MQSTPNYLWSTEDLLGQGATASVYKARNKKSGELVAVKVFNNASYLRPQEVQMREFEMLRKLNHKNIVKLFAVEETGSSKQKVLVMEFCSSGSLLNVLEDPANAFGLAESEFLIVLQCVDPLRDAAAGTGCALQWGSARAMPCCVLTYPLHSPGNLGPHLNATSPVACPFPVPFPVPTFKQSTPAPCTNAASPLCPVAGMNHLRENGVVHRDIKPGNIMRLMGEDGQSIYKLTDFGAARELDDDEKFVSVYGTEEYLHPDMYKRAVLRKPQQKAFGVTVDLWSIGVTFYHAATGSLPFVPFGGPRRNKEIMYKITTEKPPGAIAGVQRQENGSIEWSYELPVTCQLSTGLKDQLIPILANILEVDQEKCWGFDQFFAETNDILHRIVVDVFSLQQASLHRIYIHSYNTTTKFLDAVFKQTNIVPHHQEYFFEGHLYELDPNLQADHFYRTTENNPLTLLSTAEHPEEVVGVRYRDPTLDFPKFVPKVDVVADCSAAKSAVGAGYQTLRIARALRRCRELLARALHWVIGNLKTECSRILEQKRGAFSMLACLQLTEVRGCSWRQRGAGSEGRGRGEDQAADGESVRGREHPQRSEQPPPSSPPHLQVSEELSQCSHSIFDFEGVLNGLLSELVKHRQQVHEDKSIQQIECCVEKMQLIYKQFKKARTCLRLGYNEEQIHKLDKVNLGHLARKVLLIFQDDCVQRYQEALTLHGRRMRKVYEIKKHLKRLSNRISACSVEMTECQDCLHSVLDRFLQTEKRSLAPVPPAPSPVHLSQARQEMAFRMQELLEQMRSVTCDLQFNNGIIERFTS
ncbi:inhibitor of nuclear factor kappa-B kinase subunit epsilon isoform X4 [Patagioenas fasciata]|uniref:inhibitor of nuclear factor kappa-B kinase subunit epsilon isoform X4 n=1 Tax=Patagioenas fasciata TaxID=372321 RepID=UPI003A9904E3